MKKIKFLLLAMVLAVTAVIISTPARVDASTELGQTLVYVQVPADWEAPAVWAWGSASGGLWDHIGWPGIPMMQDPGNPGWYFQWMASDMTGGLVNANGGSIQTDDFPLTGETLWVTVTGPGDGFTHTTVPQTTGWYPSMTTAIFAQVPDGWDGPGIWAWGGDTGSSHFDAWPGTAYMRRVPNNDGWYFFHVPADMTGGLIHANDGSIQTSDFSLEGGHVWVTVSGEGGDFEATNTQQTTGWVPQMYSIVYVQVPDGWESPGIWAWGSVTGGLWENWPGEPMAQDPNNPGWYFQYVPTDMTGMLINGSDGVQTDDFAFGGHPLWVTVTGTGDNFTLSEFQQTAGAFPPFVPRAAAAAEEGSIVLDAVVIYAQVPENWEEPALWAWGPRGDASSVGWPGDVIFTPDPNNPGWYYTFLPADKTGALINANEGTIQTSDFRFEGVPVWITVHNDDGDFDVTTEQQTSGALQARDPFVFGAEPEVEIPDADIITLRAFVPEDWESPSVWAWTDGIGNAFRGASWPGQEFTEKEGDWYVMQIPGWIENIIIAANGGSVQMRPDPEVEPGRDVWIIVSTEFAWEVLYASVDNPADREVAAPERAGPVAITADPTPTPAATPAPPPANDDGGLSTTVIIIIIAAAVIAVLGAGAFLIIKKKK
ncbi:MAG: starch-binding protein [Defluviitaleaceae bacterium]|nr:starch-binding protein [Defluviitaleaceae bacterium]